LASVLQVNEKFEAYLKGEGETGTRRPPQIELHLRLQ
jgi:hypothetical protein